MDISFSPHGGGIFLLKSGGPQDSDVIADGIADGVLHAGKPGCPGEAWVWDAWIEAAPCGANVGQHFAALLGGDVGPLQKAIASAEAEAEAEAAQGE